MFSSQTGRGIYLYYLWKFKKKKLWVVLFVGCLIFFPTFRCLLVQRIKKTKVTWELFHFCSWKRVTKDRKLLFTKFFANKIALPGAILFLEWWWYLSFFYLYLIFVLFFGSVIRWKKNYKKTFYGIKAKTK